MIDLVMSEKSLKLTDRFIAIHMWRYSVPSDEGILYMAQSVEIMRTLGLGKTTVYRSLGRLLDAGLVGYRKPSRGLNKNAEVPSGRVLMEDWVPRRMRKSV